VGARVHSAVAERRAREPIRESGVGLECQRVHRAVVERGGRTSRGAWDRLRVSVWRVKLR
jgi:hypothetical protein